MRITLSLAVTSENQIKDSPAAERTTVVAADSSQ